MKVTTIKMKSGCRESSNLCEIDSIYLEEMGMFYKKEVIYDYLLTYPIAIQTNNT